MYLRAEQLTTLSPGRCVARGRNDTKEHMHRTILVLAIATSAAISLPAQNAKPTFSKDVAPILQQNCQTCHRPGQAAPFSLLTYELARPWAKAIKAAVLQKKMPPWFADPRFVE